MSRLQAYSLIGGILTVVALCGLVLWWPPGAQINNTNQLGALLLGATIVALTILVAEFLASMRLEEIDDRNALAAQERELRREEAEEALERVRRQSMDKWAVQLVASFQQDLRGIDLSGRDLSGLYLRACNLLRANLKGANLRGTNLNGAYLAWAYLGEANLQGADLRDADLAGAGLGEADFSEANLCGTNLTRADLTNAELAGARYDFRTVWPEQFEPHERGAVNVAR